MAKHITSKQKLEYLLLLIERDGGWNCYYCKQSLTFQSTRLEHLNNNRNDNRLENLVLACQSCNIKKISDCDYRIMATNKLQKNEDEFFLRARISVSGNISKEASTEIEINTSNFEITERYLSESIAANGSVEYSDALNSCVYLCKKTTGHGSQQSVRNYFATLTSSVGLFEIIRDDAKRKVIVRRSGN